ncbi:MAG: hypothetical protein ABIJ08_06720 [Nanoarchaeota archaeon]|uniref:Uncharacterized protein n=1 Tax=viral metagenome TaxID=1070528 RepID=A0A6M3KWV2_9ZZZZ
MSRDIEVITLLGNGRQDCNSITLSAGASCTFYFKASGVNTASAKYYDLRQPARKVAIQVSVASSLTHINGRALTSPVPLAVGWNTFKSGIDWTKITIRADAGATVTVLAY